MSSQYGRRQELVPHVLRLSQVFANMNEDYLILETGSESTNNLLQGGICTGEMTEVVGASNSGKTQFCLSLVSHIASASDYHIAYIDTCLGFSAERIQDIIQSQTEDMSPQSSQEAKIHEIHSMSKIQCFHAFNVLQLLDILEYMREQLISKLDNFWKRLRVVVIDSVGALLAPILGGKSFRGHHFLFTVSRAIKSLATEFNLAIVTTNHTVQSFNTGKNTKPALGEQWTSCADTRLTLDKHEDISHSSNSSSSSSSSLPTFSSAPSQAQQATGILRLSKSSKSVNPFSCSIFFFSLSVGLV